MSEKRLKLEKEINDLPVHEQLKILKSLSKQLKVFQYIENEDCIKNGHEFGRWNKKVYSARGLVSSDRRSYFPTKEEKNEWKRYCVKCGCSEVSNHQPLSIQESTFSEPVSIEKPKRPFMKMYHDI